MKVITIPCLSDNFAYLIICEQTGQAGVVDPSVAKPVLRVLEEAGVELVAILNTHHHWDHVGANKALVKRFANLRVYGHHSDRGRIPRQTHFLEEGDQVEIGHLRGEISHNPGHTTGAITYYFEDAAFTGDTLFAGGCGRLFEGSPTDMYKSLNQTIGKRPPATKIYFAHEYTVSNLKFALSVEPDNQAVQTKLDQVKKLRAAGRFSTPTTLADEWATNPFMRCEQAALQAAVKAEEPQNSLAPSEVFRVIRGLKDKF